ncbi:sulfotransferase 1A1 [Aplysia californica]|uniref:Sulfotransferase 1A1 n=1 Tax=Aplysia californica TaxID=6500 RepID=A0ABM0JJZ1_APLCA|nr:sulfotransferase 1A1 [Aplysia californica]
MSFLNYRFLCAEKRNDTSQGCVGVLFKVSKSLQRAHIQKMDRVTSVKPLSNPEVLESARAQFRVMKTYEKDGIPYLGSTFVSDFEEMFRQISDVKLKDDDVFLIGFMRSGNHWVSEILSMILRQTATFTDFYFHSRFPEIMGIEVHEKFQAIPEPRIIITHIHPNRLPRDVLKKPVKFVYILRNPKDTLASWYKLTTSLNNDGDCFYGSWDEFFELQLTGEFCWGSWFQHVLAWEKFMKENPNVPVFVVQFEKLKEQPKDVIADLCRFLGRPDTLTEEIATATSFENMKIGTKEKEKEADKILMKEGETMAMVSGKTQQWKKRFTVDQNERFDKFFEEALAGNGLADRVKEYIGISK